MIQTSRAATHTLSSRSMKQAFTYFFKEDSEQICFVVCPPRDRLPASMQQRTPHRSIQQLLPQTKESRSCDSQVTHHSINISDRSKPDRVSDHETYSSQCLHTAQRSSRKVLNSIYTSSIRVFAQTSFGDQVCVEVGFQ